MSVLQMMGRLLPESVKVGILGVPYTRHHRTSMAKLLGGGGGEIMLCPGQDAKLV